jgi:hypothetical protein
MSEPLQTKEELLMELRDYKETVHQLSFQLEMLKDKSHIPHERVMAVRRHALKQASEFVMDWGVPKSGGDLVDLCKQIKDLPETKRSALDRAIEEIDIAFKMRS